MAEANDKVQLLYRNLQDAGCTPEMIQKCMELDAEQNCADLLFQLSQYRKTLLEQVHLRQKELDCLDFLIYRLKKQKSQI